MDTVRKELLALALSLLVPARLNATLLWASGFESGKFKEGDGAEWIASGQCGNTEADGDSVIARSGTYSMMWSSTNTTTTCFGGSVATGSAPEYYGRFYIYITTRPSSNIFLSLADINTKLFLNTDRTITMWDVSPDPDVAVGTSTQIPYTTWTLIEWHVKNVGTNNDVMELSKNGVVEVSVSDRNFGDPNFAVFSLGIYQAPAVATSLKFNIDDFAMATTGWLGAGVVAHLRPVADGAYKDFGVNQSSVIDDIPSDVNTSTASSASNGAGTWKMTLASSAGIKASDTINGVMALVVAKRGAGAAVTVGIRTRTGGADTDTGDKGLSTTFAPYRTVPASQPTFSQLNTDDSNRFEVGLKRGAGTSQTTTVAEVHAVVDYKPFVAKSGSGVQMETFGTMTDQ